MKVTLVLALTAFLSCGGGESTAEGGTPDPESKSSIKTSGENGQPAANDAKKTPEDIHSVYSFIDNRLQSHLIRDGGLLILAGSAGFVKYLRYRRHRIPWKIRSKRDGVKVAVMNGNSAAFTIPLLRAQAADVKEVVLRLYSPVKRRLGIRFNGQKKYERTRDLAAGWATVKYSVPAGALRAGENEFIFFASKGGPLELQWAQIGGNSSESQNESKTEFHKNGSLLLPEHGGFVQYVVLPEGIGLRVSVEGSGCRVNLVAMSENGKSLKAVFSAGKEYVSLASLGGDAARLEFQTSDCKRASLTSADLMARGKAKIFHRGNIPKPKYVIMWIMDSLRADRVRVFNSKARPTVPVMEELAKSSAVFLRTYVQGNESRSSHSSIWASVYPAVHRVFNHKSKLADKWRTVDEVAKAANMFTSGVSGNGYIIGRRGYGTRWDAYRNHIHDGGGLAGADLLDRALKSVEKRHQRGWFLYLGTIDTHVSWRAKEPWMSKYDPRPYHGKFKKTASGAAMGKVASGKIKVSKRDIEHIIALYDSNVSYQDALVGKLLEKLKEWGIEKETMIIITSDHGDEQWEVGRVGHGGSLRESLVHVPLLVHYPPLFPAATIREGVEVIDIVPTIADALGVPADPSWQGVTLVPLANGEGQGYPRLTMASQFENAHAARLGHFKIRATSARTRLYNLKKDPAEKKNIAAKSLIARRAVADPLWMLRAFNRKWKKAIWGNAANVNATFARDLNE